MVEYVDCTFENERVELDGKRWVSCTFRNCVIVAATGNFALVGCNLYGCQLSLGGNAQNIVALIELFFPGHLPFAPGSRPNPRFEPPKE